MEGPPGPGAWPLRRVMRILLIEDDMMLGEAVLQGLRQEGYAADWVRDGISAQLAIGDACYGLVLLDLGLPGKSGLDVLRKARADGLATPVLVLTARDEVPDRIKALDSGADDYMVKPFSLDEMLARIRVLLRRAAGRRAPRLQRGSIDLDPASHRVMHNQQPIELSPREFNILQALLESEGEVVSRRRLEDMLYGWGDEVESNSVEVHIHRLRRKLGRDAIQTVRGAGYRLAGD